MKVEINYARVTYTAFKYVIKKHKSQTAKVKEIIEERTTDNVVLGKNKEEVINYLPKSSFLNHLKTWHPKAEFEINKVEVLASLGKTNYEI